jgi:hypothetical protein
MRIRTVVGIAIGGVVDIVATNILSLIFMIYVAVYIAFAHAGEQPRPDLAVMLNESPPLHMSLTVLGLTASAIGGYVAALIARRSFVVCGALSAWLCVTLGLVALFGGSTAPWWEHALSSALSPTLGTIGGFLRLVQTRRRTSALPDGPLALSPG